MKMEECPVCGNKLDSHPEPSWYQYNKGLPKSFTASNWVWYDCEECYKKKRSFAFVCAGNRLFTWDCLSNSWKKLILNSSNPSRRDSR